MPSMQIRVIQQSDPDPADEKTGWYMVDDFDEKDAAAIRVGELERYTVEVISTDDQGVVTVRGDSLNHVAIPGLAGVYTHPCCIHYSATEMIRAAKDELTGAAGLEVGDHVVRPGQRPGGAGRLFEVLAVPKDDEGFGLGTVTVRQLDAIEGTGERELLVSVVSKDIPPRVPIEGRDRGGIGESFRRREGGGFLVFHGDFADQVVMSPTALGGALWGCRSIDEFGDDAWEYGSNRDDAVRAHGRKYPNRGLTN
ncbi:hypothetical protein [Actinacidiphila sp. ITFR-21]|uniref:hypothetical protein n=1 Tax=Actinacidiphila sp. ITFR-21 TaxID=3075199 RepID=UPI00288AC0BE|nr:hypothetical protein [Streptomyces sp. ITFR-21]WNI17677.1 hypothetical protein RLT57_20520 [Streptomyces sp. ITFR-21]WNI17817.1 hypothetical protein RLT57_21235 [Streptomyces sp. ITFR-21]